MDIFPEELVGLTIGARYELTRLVGVGGMGAVYEARKVDGELFAVKLILPRAIEDLDALRRFAREGTGALSIQSENVVRVVEAGYDRTLEIPFIVMELLRGSDLALILRERGVLDPAKAARIFSDLCKGIAKAHAQGVIHRDIKPANIFLHERDDGTIVSKLCDFGIAKLSATLSGPDGSEPSPADLTHTGGMLGSPIYMSPEQTRDPKSVDQATDIWSLGICLYRTLSGHHPWDADAGVAQIVLSIHIAEVTPLQQWAPWVRPELAEIVHKCLQREKEKRWESVEKLQEALERCACPTIFADEELCINVDQKRTVSERYTGQYLSSSPLETKSFAPTPKKKSARSIFLAPLLAIALGMGVFVAMQPPRRANESVGACTKKADCERLGAGYFCRAGICTDQRECETNADCVAKHNGDPFICRKADAACVALGSVDCTVVSDRTALVHDDTIWIGTMFPLTGPSASEFGSSFTEAVEIARTEFVQARGGLPSRGNRETIRPIGLITCDDASDARRAGQHLVENVGVPAIIGFQSSKEVIDLSISMFIPNDVLVIATVNSSSLITGIPHPKESPRLVWRTAVNVIQWVAPISALVSTYVEPKLRAPGGAIRGDGEMRLALVRPDNTAGLTLVDALQAGIRFNAKSSFENGTNFRDVAFRERVDSASSPRGQSKTLERLLAALPHAIVATATNQGELFEDVLAPLERSWPMSHPYRPVYLFPGAVEAEEAVSFLAEDPSRAKRMLGLTRRTDYPSNIQFTTRYNKAYGTQYSPVVSPTAPYDSFYLLMYATYAANASRPTGSALARAIGELVPPGKQVDIGPESMSEVLDLLDQRKRVDLQGTSGRLDFDLGNGEAAADFDVLCIRYDKKSNAIENIASGLRYNSSSATLEGALSCDGE